MSTVASDEALPVIDDVRIEIDNYKATVEALRAFIGSAIWEEGDFIRDTHYCLGRRMDTSSNNAISSETPITPDAVVQQSVALGYVVEAKKTLPSNQDYWQDDVKQVRKYDDDLMGWWTPDERMPESGVVVLIGAPRVAEFAEFVRHLATEEGWSFAGKVCFVEFARVREVSQYIHLRRHEGEITDAVLADKLQRGDMVPLEGLVVTFGPRKFYDSEPPTEYLMETLWQDVFNPMKSEVEYDEALGCWPLEVEVSDLTTEVQQLFGSPGGEPRQVEYPQRDWVKGALDAFVRIGLAKRRGNGEYTILFRRILGNVIEKFARQRLRPAPEEKPEVVQLKLLES